MRIKAIYELYSTASTMDRGKVYDVDNNLIEIDEELIQAKIAELEAAEPIRLLRQERNRRLAETDWMANSDVVMTDKWKTYRQALRDLPATAEPKLDDVGNLTNVTWPEVPE